MERNLYPENFEKFLKRHADQFKMRPSKKVWHGIYNDLHPGTRWPSVTMSLIFIFTLVIIGHLNTNNPAHVPGTSGLAAAEIKSTDEKPFSNSKTLLSRQYTSTISDENISKNTNSVNGEKIADYAQNALPENTSGSAVQKALEPLDVNNGNTPIIAGRSDDSVADNSGTEVKEPFVNEDVQLADSEVEQASAKQQLALPATVIENENNFLKSSKSKKSKPEWSYFITPSISYRSFSDNPLGSNINTKVTHKPIAAFEIGTSMNFKVTKKLQFTTGIQFNYSGYKIKASSVHPTSASLQLQSTNVSQGYSLYPATSYFSNAGAQESRLKNYSAQVSIPIGLQYAFAGNDNVQFHALISVQPSYTFLSKAYMLSSDQKNYVTYPDLYRKLNMNTSLGAFVSFKSNSLNWQIGPQVRYQLFSTYNARYPYKEHLINYGIRLGLSKF